MPDSSGLHTIACPPSQLIETACAHIVRAHEAESPDLTRPTLLLPHLQARQTVARALRTAARVEVLMLPRITTLRQWAADAGQTQAVLPGAARVAMLYQALSERHWFDHADLWAIAGELSGLFDELTRWHVGMPCSAADFERQLERAYRARAGASFAFEARLVHELWHAFAGADGHVDEEIAYQLRLGELLDSVTEPVYAVGLAHLAPSERQFLEHCAARVYTVCFREEMTSTTGMSWPECTLAQAWPEASAATLQERARQLRGASAASGLGGRVRLFGALGVEQEAIAVDLSIRRWLSHGREEIGVVVLDRVIARRARALLERAEILVRDEAGWALSTTSAATVLSRWFDAASNGFYHRDLLDLLKSPFAFCEWSRDARQQAVWRLERALRKANLRTGLENYLALAQRSGDTELRQMLLDVQRAARALGRARPKTLSRWLNAVDASIKEIGVHAGLESDAAGGQLLDLLDRMQHQLANVGVSLGFAEFRRWLARCLESATFQDASIDSPVVFTSLQATHLRRFDAVLVMGADATHLPGVNSPGPFFNQNVRRELGLPGRAEQVREVEERLFGLIANAEQVLVTWQCRREGEPNLLSPVFERLRSLHRLAWGDSLDDSETGAASSRRTSHATSGAAVPITTQPSPRSPPTCVPSTISASAYNALMACPYQFFARYVLHLREQDDVQEELDKADYGSRIHAILHRFHCAYPYLGDVGTDDAQAALGQLSQAAFREVIAADYLASAWLARWQALIPRYVEWQRAREAEGWRFFAGEVERSVSIRTPAGRVLNLRGRIDRVDVREADRAVAVVDYKTQPRKRLQDKLAADGEDVQLPVYALLWGGPVAAALFLSADQKDVESVELEGDIDALAYEVRARIGRLFDRISEGAPLPAHGIDAVCHYCEMGGLCRRKHWA